MPFHTEIMMSRWVVTSNKERLNVLKSLQKLPMHIRLMDRRVAEYIAQMKRDWSRGTKIERMATFGWNDTENTNLLCVMIENLDDMISNYKEQVALYGPPPEFNDAQFDEYKKAVDEEVKNMSNNK